MAKIYLSAAAHATDNRTQCPVQCSENTHCNQYMDKLEPRLREVGFEVMRGDPALTGSQAMSVRVTEANRWKADIYYVAHTNAGGGRYSMTMCYTDKASRAKAEVIHKHRRCVKHIVRQTASLYEINATAMPCLYDELFFHDNAEDCAWFHNGGMDVMVEETVQALCEICGVTYQPHAAPEQPTEPVNNAVKEWQNAAIADGYAFPRYGADGKWGSECESVARKAVVKRRLTYQNRNLTRIVQRHVGVAVDGLCGKNTDKAIRTWQKANGLTADGAVGINSWKKILGI